MFEMFSIVDLIVFGFLVFWGHKFLASGDEEENTNPEGPEIVNMKCETVEDVIYCYNSASDEFLCQGRTLDEIQTHFASRFPEVVGRMIYLDQRAQAILKPEVLKGQS
jgi:hypothetical protein